MKLQFKENTIRTAYVGDVLYLDNRIYALVIDTAEEGFQYLNISQPEILPKIAKTTYYNEIKTMRRIGTLKGARLELLKMNTLSRPVLTDDTPTNDDYLGAIALNNKNDLLFIYGVRADYYEVYNTHYGSAYHHICKDYGDLYILAKYSDYTLHFEE